MQFSMIGDDLTVPVSPGGFRFAKIYSEVFRSYRLLFCFRFRCSTQFVYVVFPILQLSFNLKKIFSVLTDKNCIEKLISVVLIYRGL